MHEIEKNILIPNDFPKLRNMDIGDSFYTEEPIQRVRPFLVRQMKTNNMQIITRKEGKGYRIWRAKDKEPSK